MIKKMRMDDFLKKWVTNPRVNPSYRIFQNQIILYNKNNILYILALNFLQMNPRNELSKLSYIASYI